MEDYEAGRKTASVYDTLNRLVVAEEMTADGVMTGSAVTRSYGYDKRGNLIREERNGEFLRGYEYGAMDRMTRAWNSRGQESDYFYNGLGQRMGRTVNGEEEDYLLDLSKPYHNLLGISKGDSRQNFYFDNNVSVMEEEGNLHYYLQDELGSPLWVSGYGAGKEYLTYGYDEFGNDLYRELEEAGIPCPYDRQGEEQPFGYTGYRFDDVSGTYFAQAREYRAESGRFTAEDVVKGNDAEPETLNRYGYCWNAPLLYIDLDGDTPEIPEYILELIEQGDDAHQTLIRYAYSSPHDGILKAPAYIPKGLKREKIEKKIEKNRKKGEGLGYYTKSGHGYADFVLYDEDTGILEVYELKHDSGYGKERGPVQLQAYIDAINRNLDEFNSVHHWNVTMAVPGTSMLGIFNNHYPSVLYGKEIYYHMDPNSKGMIYWSYTEEQKQPAKQPYIGMSKEEIEEFFHKAGYVLGGIGIGLLGVFLCLDNLVPGGEADDHIAEELLLKAVEFFENAFGKCTLMH